MEHRCPPLPRARRLAGQRWTQSEPAHAAYDSSVDFPPREQIEEAETRLFSLAETGKYVVSALSPWLTDSTKPWKSPCVLTSVAAAFPDWRRSWPQREDGPAKIRDMIVDDVRAAQARGDPEHVRTLLHVLHHFLKAHPDAVPLRYGWNASLSRQS